MVENVVENVEDTVRVTTDLATWMKAVKTQDTFAPNQRARFATEFINRWGAVAAIPEGEDSSGRQAMRMATPEELVTRACETAELLHLTLAARGWLVAVPEPPVKSDRPEIEGPAQ